MLLFVMGKRRRQGQEGRERAMSEEGKESNKSAQYVLECVRTLVFFSVRLCSGGRASHCINEREEEENALER